MGVNHADFFRILPRAMGDTEYRLDGLRVHGRLNSGTVTITVGSEQVRRIALLAIPFCEVTFDYNDVATDTIEAFEDNFQLYFRRGGG